MLFILVLISNILVVQSEYFCEFNNDIFHLRLGPKSEDILIEAKMELGELVIRGVDCKIWRSLEVVNETSWWESKIAEAHSSFDIMSCGTHKTPRECLCSYWEHGCDNSTEYCNVCGDVACPDRRSAKAKCPYLQANKTATPSISADTPSISADTHTEEMSNLLSIVYFTSAVVIVVIVFKCFKHRNKKKYIEMAEHIEVDVESTANGVDNMSVQMSEVNIDSESYKDTPENEIFN